MFPVSTYNTYSAAEDMTNMGALLQYHRSRVPTGKLHQEIAAGN